MEILIGRSHQILGYRCANDLGLFGAKTAPTFHFNVTARATKQNFKLSMLISVRLEWCITICQSVRLPLVVSSIASTIGKSVQPLQGRIEVESAGGAHRKPPPPPEITCGFLIQLVFCIKIGLRHQSVTLFLSGASPPKKNPGSVPAPPPPSLPFIKEALKSRIVICMAWNRRKFNNSTENSSNRT